MDQQVGNGEDFQSRVAAPPHPRGEDFSICPCDPPWWGPTALCLCSPATPPSPSITDGRAEVTSHAGILGSPANLPDDGDRDSSGMARGAGNSRLPAGCASGIFAATVYNGGLKN